MVFGFLDFTMHLPASFLHLFSAASLNPCLPPHLLSLQSHLSGILPRNLLSHNAHIFTLDYPLPTLPCPHCPWHFNNKTGCTRHIQVIHHDNSDIDGHEPQDCNVSLPLSPSVKDPGSQHLD